jgi:hypothetical protein
MQNHIHTAVSQYAKMPLPTPKTATTKDLEVGKQPKNFLHTPTHTGENSKSNFTLLENIDKKTVTDFIALVQSLYPQYIVSFTPHSYLKTHFSNGSKDQLDLFLNLVQAFTLLHHSNRKTTVENVLAALDSDYVEAFKLWQHCQPKPSQPVYIPTINRVLQFLQYRYKEQSFTSQKIAAQLNYSTNYIRRVMEQLQQQKHIQVLEINAYNAQRLFKLIA